mgnify:CR=1 FL=1
MAANKDAAPHKTRIKHNGLSDISFMYDIYEAFFMNNSNFTGKANGIDCIAFESGGRYVSKVSKHILNSGSSQRMPDKNKLVFGIFSQKFASNS